MHWQWQNLCGKLLSLQVATKMVNLLDSSGKKGNVKKCHKVGIMFVKVGQHLSQHCPFVLPFLFCSKFSVNESQVSLFILTKNNALTPIYVVLSGEIP